MAYCELTDEKNGAQRFALNDLREEELVFLSDLLNSVSGQRVAPLRRAVNGILRTTGNFHFRVLKPEAVICPVCRGNTKTVEELIANNDRKINDCNTCHGKGRMLRFQTVRYEPFTPYWENELADLPKSL